MTAMRLHRYPSPSGGIALGKMGVGATMMRNILPAGARWVEYLQGMGSQWIDTGINANTSVVLNCDFRFIIAAGNRLNGTYGNFGRLQFGIVNGVWSIGIGSVGVSGTTADVLRHSVSINVPQKQAFFDGINYGDYSSASAQYESYQTILLFARTNKVTTYTPFVDCHCIERIFSCQITSNNTLVRDFAPIAIGTTGYMLDLVSGEYLQYGNKGTGDFTIGPDINAPAI